MRISAKSRYALAAVIHMARLWGTGEPVTVPSIAEKLGLSKIYLEQSFALLRRGGLVGASKGAQGGYLLAPAAEEITVFDVLSASELPLWKKRRRQWPKKPRKSTRPCARLRFARSTRQ
jgi:Rrf2 family protein